MTLALLVMLALMQQPSCGGEREALDAARLRVAAFDIAGAADRLGVRALRGCIQAEAARAYLRGLLAAREAYRQGGDAASLGPVREAVKALEARGSGRPSMEIAKFVLLASISAAQSEREEMAVFLQHAVTEEAEQLATGQPPAPLVTAHEIAGDLWLQVHQYERARDAYKSAARQLGERSAITLGLARVAARMKDTKTACAEYRTLFARWHWGTDGPAAIAEGRAYLREHACEVVRNPQRRR